VEDSVYFTVFGRYFSTHGCSFGAATTVSVFSFELEAVAARALLSKKLAMAVGQAYGEEAGFGLASPMPSGSSAGQRRSLALLYMQGIAEV
jgi:hypothetical protein